MSVSQSDSRQDSRQCTAVSLETLDDLYLNIYFTFILQFLSSNFRVQKNRLQTFEESWPKKSVI